MLASCYKVTEHLNTVVFPNNLSGRHDYTKITDIHWNVFS